MFNIYVKKILTYIFIFTLCFPQIIFADTISSSLINISARVAYPSENNGGGSNGFLLTIPTSVNFSGLAYPNSRVYLLKNNKIVSSTTSDKLAHFSISINRLLQGNYSFSIYTEDINGNRSSLFKLPIYLNNNNIVDIKNIFLSPTIVSNKIYMNKTDKLNFSGQGIPNSKLRIFIDSLTKDNRYYYDVSTNNDGFYFYGLDAKDLKSDTYKVQSLSFVDSSSTSLLSENLFLRINDSNDNLDNKKYHCSSLRSDFNCDGRVDLTDYSILIYWYNKKSNIPDNIDLNGDNIINMVDFSILAFNWTGY